MRRKLLRALLALGVVVASALAAEAFGKPPKTNSSVQVTLKQQLQKGLKCRRPVEFEFVDRVVRLVEEEKLSIDTVNKAFAWSRHRNSFRPFVYFERSLVELAKRDGVDVNQEFPTTKKVSIFR